MAMPLSVNTNDMDSISSRAASQVTVGGLNFYAKSNDNFMLWIAVAAVAAVYLLRGKT